ncbi:nitroreductase family protein [Bacillus sp. FJAT-49736]|uniref:nitroreductase family protein n=1 Tax=Bacillus sp. FJAT-49736 TaxID=2833582 RepID=UPI001BCA64D4|nr:nitroreductase family protein [Bacillus sp. FJAT-49736]MBS4174955.1 nitroreductase family protein [Bacillus sp. FJAT-49736]
MNTEEVNTLALEIMERKSVTNWTEQQCSRHTWDLLIEAARRSPSSWNHQPARYILLDEKESILKIENALHRTNRWALKAAGLIVQVANPEDDDQIAGKDYYLYDCGVAMMSIIYQATIMGITCRQMIGWDEAEVKRILQIPKEFRIVVITAIGYPTSSGLSKITNELKRKCTGQDKRYHPKHTFFWGTWNGGNKDEGR